MTIPLSLNVVAASCFVLGQGMKTYIRTDDDQRAATFKAYGAEAILFSISVNIGHMLRGATLLGYGTPSDAFAMSFSLLCLYMFFLIIVRGLQRHDRHSLFCTGLWRRVVQSFTLLVGFACFLSTFLLAMNHGAVGGSGG